MAYTIGGADVPTSVFIAGKVGNSWFNLFGLIVMIFIMIPNIVFALKCKDGFDNAWQNRAVETLEQIGRFGCFGLMVINIPGTYFDFVSMTTYLLYILIDMILVFLYCLIWIICFRKNSIFRALALSILPATLFVYSGIMSRSILLIIAAIIFAPCHIILSYKNAVCSLKNK